MNPVDRYDVEHMIRAACVALRSELSQAVRELTEMIGEERVDRQDAVESLQRVIDSRTEHLA